MIRRLQKDLDDFESLIRLARKKHPPNLPFAGGINNEFVSFLELFTQYNRHGHAEPRKFVEDVSTWIYHSSAFGNKTKASLFFEMLNELLDSNDLELDRLNFLEEFND